MTITYISSIFAVVDSLSYLVHNGNKADLTDDEKKSVKSGLADPEEDTSASSVKAPLRDKLKTVAEKHAQKRQDVLGQKSMYCSGVKKHALHVSSSPE